MTLGPTNLQSSSGIKLAKIEKLDGKGKWRQAAEFDNWIQTCRDYLGISGIVENLFEAMI